MITHWAMPGGIVSAGRRGLAEARAWQVWGLRPALRAYVIAVVAATSYAVSQAPFSAHDAVTYLGLVGCGLIVLESAQAIREVKGGLFREFEPWYLAMAVNLPPVYALSAAFPFAAWRQWRMRRGFAFRFGHRRLFSTATVGLGYGAASWLFHSVPHWMADPLTRTWWHILAWTGAAAACGVLAQTVNMSLVTTAIKLADGRARFRAQVTNRETARSDLVELTAAMSLSLLVAISPALILLAVPSLVLTRRQVMKAQLTTQARIDTETAVLNKTTWSHQAEVSVFHALRTRTPLAILLAEIDHFGSSARTGGRAGAGEVLRAVAGILDQSLQGAGLTGRLDDAQFAILLPGASEDGARHLAERARDHIAGQAIAAEDASETAFVFRPTVSIGVAVLSPSEGSLESLLAAAESALAVARATGHNRVCMAPAARDGHVPGGGGPWSA